MDGPSGPFPSTPIGAEPGTPTSFTHRPSIRELYSRPISMPTTGIDPPRPAREGCEWVWFPAGYWAEREVVETPPAKDPNSARGFRWGKRPHHKSGSESPRRSPGNILADTSPAERTEKPLDYAARRRSLTRTAGSSESAASFFPTHRTPLPSPYLTEEAHVQSLQWPSIDAAARTSSSGGGSLLRSRAVLSPSPLHLSSAEDELEADRNVSPSTSGRGRGLRHTSSDVIETEFPAPDAADDGGGGARPKKAFANWWMLAGHRQVKKSRSLDEQRKGDVVRTQQLSGSQDAAAGPSRKESSVSDKSHRSLKSCSVRLLAKARWRRKTSAASSGASSSSLPPHDSVVVPSQIPAPFPPIAERAPTNSWASEFPGGEAIRVQTPRIIQNAQDAFPRSFFSDLTPPSTNHNHNNPNNPNTSNNHNRTGLSTHFTPGDSTASSTPTPTPTLTPRHQRAHLYRDEAATPTPTRPPTPMPPMPMPPCKEWWEVSVPRSFGDVDRRAFAFRFDLPEHLPSSPMCPANKRHKSGGTGVCVYHGRAKGGSGRGSGTRGGTRGGGGDGDEDVDVDVDSEELDTDEAGSDVWK
ncbi:hypothetical protein F5Y14DRAFT_211181 [Nemania sp. NC0429]|nr:hypothetical protein F5Y14DRAFT_211181 [Nemania sp. NC0429]